MFGFPTQNRPDDFQFTHNMLQSATFQVKYSSATSFSELTGEVINALIGSFPTVKHLQQGEAGWKAVEADEKSLSADRKQPKVLRFSSNDDAKAFVVSEDALTMTIAGPAYSSFPIVQSEIYEAIESVQRVINITSFDKVAIRKINSLNVTPGDEAIKAGNGNPWPSVLKDFFSENLISHTTALPASGKLVSTVVNSRFEDGSDTLNLIYGLAPKAEEDGSRQLVLDIDLFSKCEYHSIEQVRNKFSELNKEVFDIFMWSIPEAFRNAFINAPA